MSSPPSRIRPASGRSNPAISRSVVVFPEPEGPRSVKNSPSPTRRSTSCTATTAPYVFRIPSTATSASKALLQDVQSAREVLVRDRARDEDAALLDALSCAALLQRHGGATVYAATARE